MSRVVGHYLGAALKGGRATQGGTAGQPGGI